MAANSRRTINTRSSRIVRISDTDCPWYEVAVVGGGPAGLTTAQYTTRLSHRTAVFEREGADTRRSATFTTCWGFRRMSPAGNWQITPSRMSKPTAGTSTSTSSNTSIRGR
ncbi:NAD(P)-binding protein [Halostagnicola sp. A-GB9-2]|uniref:NAD(P)-binding protein n=1 Tax=Halostagnicola sp. A-GB9-2 TaxID=3048066 RepID=UPI0031F32965